jgi:hypothetical protein
MAALTEDSYKAKKDVIKMIRSCRNVYGMVFLTDDDGAYFKMEKKHLIYSLGFYSDTDRIKIYEKNGDCYIN